MCPLVVNPPPTITAQAGDEVLTPTQLEKLSLFAQLGKKPSFAKLPGTTVLRRFRKGDVIVRQGAAGWTAFYILKGEDVLQLRREQLELARGQLREPPTEGSDARRARLEGRVATLQNEIATLEQDAQQAAEGFSRRAATAHLSVDLTSRRRRGILSRLRDSLSGASRRLSETLPQFIPNDGPADIRLDTRRAPLHEGELFGEMSCMSRTPRSATVVADRDCYMLEMLRNILDQVRKDPAYKAQTDKIYRERVLSGQLRRLSIFADLSDEQFARVCSQVELITLEPGQVICDEHDASDSFYVIRSGLVKVVKNLHLLLRVEDIPASGWPALLADLAAGRDQSAGPPSISPIVWKLLPEAVRDSLAAGAPMQAADPIALSAKRAAVVAALNAMIKGRELVSALGKKKQDLLAEIDSAADQAQLAEFPEKVEEWTEIEVREFNRYALESISPPTIPKRRLLAVARRTLAYLGRGDFFGEKGVIDAAPRNSTCIAYNHPDNGQAVASGAGITPSRVELVRIGRQEFLDLCESAPLVRAKVQAEAVARQRRTQESAVERPWDAGRPAILNPRFEELGLIQGQKLLLIDLDRCTRCGDCVRACINTHDDGATRLYLDGPRFGKYLVPNACRKCLDPVCMIGCPVGSIVRGEDGQIVIQDWCIGCELCAEQCPYGSIHMNLLEELRHVGPSNREAPESPETLPEGVEIREVEERAVVCDLCSTLASKEPACVYHCPHDAAFRIDARYEFPAT